MDNIKMDFKS